MFFGGIRDCIMRLYELYVGYLDKPRCLSTACKQNHRGVADVYSVPRMEASCLPTCFKLRCELASPLYFADGPSGQALGQPEIYA